MNTLAAGASGLEIKCTGHVSNKDPDDQHVAYRLSVQRHSTEVAKVERRWTEIKEFDRALYQLNSVSSHAIQSSSGRQGSIELQHVFPIGYCIPGVFADASLASVCRRLLRHRKWTQRPAHSSSATCRAAGSDAIALIRRQLKCGSKTALRTSRAWRAC